MIYRAMDNGWFVIAQPAHAVVSGILASEWGNDQFAAPLPRDPVVLATSLHDIGWSDRDAKPSLHADGRPVNYLETTLDDTHAVWERAVQQVALFNTYAALLVSMHADLVYTRRRERGIDPPDRHEEIDQRLAHLATFKAQSLERLSNYPHHDEAITPTRIQANYRILRACDLLSLAICTGELTAGTIEDVPASNADARVTISYAPLDPHTLALNPYPFSSPEVLVRVEGRILSQRTFPDERAFHEALQAAPWFSQEYRFVTGL